MNKRKVGADYEQRAADYLERSGFRIMDKNFYCRQGEVDLIGIHDRTLVFVEVKYRKDAGTGYPEEAVNFKKQEKICRTSDYYRFRHPELGNLQVRYDVVTICGEDFSWHRNAFDYISGNDRRRGKF